MRFDINRDELDILWNNIRLLWILYEKQVDSPLYKYKGTKHLIPVIVRIIQSKKLLYDMHYGNPHHYHNRKYCNPNIENLLKMSSPPRVYNFGRDRVALNIDNSDCNMGLFNIIYNSVPISEDLMIIRFQNNITLLIYDHKTQINRVYHTYDLQFFYDYTHEVLRIKIYYNYERGYLDKYWRKVIKN